MNRSERNYTQKTELCRDALKTRRQLALDTICSVLYTISVYIQRWVIAQLMHFI